jgi:4-carboxymuconolactone decarboxylase
MTRVPPITDMAQLPAEYHALFDRIAQARGGRLEGPYAVLLHSPAIAARLDQLPGVLRNETDLQVAEFVLAALAVARAKDALFVWSVQVANAGRAGIPDAAIAAIRDGALDQLDAAQRDLVEYVQQVLVPHRVDQALFDRLLQRHGVRWLVGLTATIGNFELISNVVNAFEVPPPDGGDLLPV